MAEHKSTGDLAPWVLGTYRPMLVLGTRPLGVTAVRRLFVWTLLIAAVGRLSWILRRVWSLRTERILRVVFSGRAALACAGEIYEAPGDS